MSALESKRTGGGSSDGQQHEEVHHKVPRPTARRDARLFSMLGSFIAAHDNVPRKIQTADQPNATDVMPVIPSAVGGPSPAGDAASTEQRRATQPDTSKHVRQTVGMKRGAEDQQRELTHHLLHYPRSCRSQMSKWRRCRCRCQKMRWK